MSLAATALVETLTAEVRVLMVGNRQITLSVARQLDWCALEDLTPFGRVRLEAAEPRVVIGRYEPTGVLRVARYRAGTEVAHLDKTDMGGTVTVCPTVTRGFPIIGLHFEGRQMTVERS